MTKIVSLGAGRMGRGIAHVFAYAGYDVKIVDFKERPAKSRRYYSPMPKEKLRKTWIS